jgi:hypothetical protein
VKVSTLWVDEICVSGASCDFCSLLVFKTASKSIKLLSSKVPCHKIIVPKKTRKITGNIHNGGIHFKNLLLLSPKGEIYEDDIYTTH